MYLIFDRTGAFSMMASVVPSSHDNDQYDSVKVDEFDPQYEYAYVDGAVVKGKPIKVDAKESAKLAAEFAATQYQRDRIAAYPSFGDQLDYIYHNGVDAWKTNIVDPIKTKYPKPEGAK